MGSSNGYAEKKTYIREYRYTVGDHDSKISAKNAAAKQMRWELLQVIGVSIQGEQSLLRDSEQDDYQEKIESISAGTIGMEILEENFDGTVYYIKANMTVDPDEVRQRINELSHRRTMERKMEQMGKEFESKPKIKSSGKTDEQLKSEIPGTYAYYHANKLEDNTLLTLEGTLSLKKNGKIADNATMTLTIIAENSNKATIKYAISAAGTYDIRKSRLVYDYSISSINFEPLREQSSGDKGAQDYLYSYMNDIVFPIMKGDMVKEHEDIITELTDKRFVVVGVEGKEETIYKRTSVWEGVGEALGKALVEAARPDCEKNNTGTIILTNNDPNPFTVYVDGVNKGIIQGRQVTRLVVPAGNHSVRVIEQSGWILHQQDSSFKPFVLAKCGEMTCTWD